MGSETAFIDCRVASIVDSKLFKGFVEVFLDPVDKSIFKHNHDDESGMILSQMTPGVSIPLGSPDQMAQMIMSIPKQLQRQHGEENDPRGILWVEGCVDFQSRGWKYGDRIRVSFEKIEEK